MHEPTPNPDISLYETPATLTHALFSFKGRINRGSFVLWHVLNLAIQLFLLVFNFGATWCLWVVFTIYPGIAMKIKRFHDRNKRGWWVLLYLIPTIGPIWCFIALYCRKGTNGANRYGLPMGETNEI